MGEDRLWTFWGISFLHFEASCNGTLPFLASVPQFFPEKTVHRPRNMFELAGTKKKPCLRKYLPSSQLSWILAPDIAAYRTLWRVSTKSPQPLRIWRSGSWHVYSGKHLVRGGGGGSSQVVLSIWLSLFITEIFYFPCHHLEEGFSKLAGNLGANNEYFSLRVTFLLLLKTLIRERLLIRPNTPIVISLHHLLKSFFCKKRSSHFHPELQDILHMIHHDHRHNHVIDLRLNSDGPQGPVWSWVELLLGTTHHNPFLRLGFKFTWKGKKITFQFFIFYLLVWTHHNPILRL